jgi:hypothetical protein
VNTIEKTTIAKGVAIYIIDHLLIEKPIKDSDLESVARSVTEGMGITESDEWDSIAALATEYVTNDKKVVMESKDGVLWVYHKRSV